MSATKTALAEPAGTAQPRIIGPFSDYLKSKKILSLAEQTVTLDRAFFLELMEPLLRRVRFDADFYRGAYEDLRKAEKQGLIGDMHQHFLRFGFFENRLPCFVEVDGSFYAREYPDVAVAIIENRVTSAQVHFETSGYAEGRIPRKDWSFAELIRD